MRLLRFASMALLVTLGGCNSKDAGYVEISTVPVSTASTPAIYLDSAKVESFKLGTTVLRQSVGTRKLHTDSGTGQLAFLCEVVVKKNRITTVIVSVLERPPRCQCRNSGPSQRTCLS